MKITRTKMKAEVPSVAMGDIAFNLLIFFVILARSQDDSHLKWKPAVTPVVEKVKQARVSIVIDTSGKLFLNSQEIGESQLADSISKQLGKSPTGDRTVFLKVDKDITALRFEPVIEAISEAGGDLVHILQEKKTPGGP